MRDLSKGAADLVKHLFKGNEQERMVSAGVVRTILSDMTKLFFDHKVSLGPGILVFNPVEPEKSKYLTKKDIECDLSVAQEQMDKPSENLFKNIIDVVEKEMNSGLALIAMIQDDEIVIHHIDPAEVNKKIDELSNGLIF